MTQKSLKAASEMHDIKGGTRDGGDVDIGGEDVS